MSVIGIVCEFNPFHNGHKHLIDSVKADGDIVVCVMSGNFVQRGEPAIFPKEVRVKSALMNGADIVLELPFVYATASAEIFASIAWISAINWSHIDKVCSIVAGFCSFSSLHPTNVKQHNTSANVSTLVINFFIYFSPFVKQYSPLILLHLL